MGQNVAERNRKGLGLCEEAVEDASSLWKAEEKCAEIKRAKRARMMFQ